MKAIILEKAGGVENLQYKEVENPKLDDNQVLIEVKAISINPADVKVKYAEEGLNMIYGNERPVVLGWDVAGVVSSVGKNVNKFKNGDRVFGMINFPGRGKAYAEYVASPQDHISLIPENITFEQAAATTLAALTALQALKDRVRKGDKVLIQGGSGGVGHFAVQIAKSLGAYVISTSSGKNRDYLLSIGVDKHVDYTTEKFEEVLSDVDFVLDSFGGNVLLNSVKVAKRGGTVITLLGNEISDEIGNLAKEMGVNISGILVQSSGDDMELLRNYLESGEIIPNIYKTFDFADMAKAHQEVETGRTVGKVIVKL